MRSWLRGYCLYLAWLIASFGLCTSFFYGEFLGISPCSLCWYQRMALFPLVVILAMALYRGDRGVVLYVLPLAAMGGLIGAFQILQRHFVFLQGPSVCKFGIQCSRSLVQVFGLIDFSWLSTIGFLMIFVLLIFSVSKQR